MVEYVKIGLLVFIMIISFCIAMLVGYAIEELQDMNTKISYLFMIDDK